jgi:hypothetical protein
MHRHLTALVAIATTLGVGTAEAQQRPDLRGVWTRVDDSVSSARTVAATGDASFRRGELGNGMGSPLTITQSTTQLVVEYPFFSTYDLQPPVRLSFSLDGSRSTNSVMLGHESTELHSTAQWADSTLVLTIVYPGPAGADASRLTTTVRHAIRMGAPGQLVVETTRSGGTVRGALPSRVTYDKR